MKRATGATKVMDHHLHSCDAWANDLVTCLISILKTKRQTFDWEAPPTFLSHQNSAFKDSSGEFISLPPRDIAVELATSALNEACALFNFVHKPSFFSMLEEIYLLNPAQYTDKEHRFLPLLYSILALGYLFSRNERVHFGYTHAISEGYV